MPGKHVLGWDIGGAHLKVAAVNSSGKVVRILCVPCPLWQGLDCLDRALSAALKQMPTAALHAVTMTGELSDFFRNRAHGVKSIIARFVRQVPASVTVIYAAAPGFLTTRQAVRKSALVASANWRASAELVAGLVPDGLFVDIGSTTTDVVPFRAGQLRNRGLNDAERLARNELVYTGVVRTPIMALPSGKRNDRSTPMTGASRGSISPPRAGRWRRKWKLPGGSWNAGASTSSVPTSGRRFSG